MDYDCYLGMVPWRWIIANRAYGEGLVMRSLIAAIIAMFSISANMASAVELSKDELDRGYIIATCDDGGMTCVRAFGQKYSFSEYVAKYYPRYELVSLSYFPKTHSNPKYLLKLKPKEHK